MTFTAKTAQEAITEILAAIPDKALPDVKIEPPSDTHPPIAWCNGIGYFLGSAKRGDKADPKVHRLNAVTNALAGEAAYRADVKYLAEQKRQD